MALRIDCCDVLGPPCDVRVRQGHGCVSARVCACLVSLRARSCMPPPSHYQVRSRKSKVQTSCWALASTWCVVVVFSPFHSIWLNCLPSSHSAQARTPMCGRNFEYQGVLLRCSTRPLVCASWCGPALVSFIGPLGFFFHLFPRPPTALFSCINQI